MPTTDSTPCLAQTHHHLTSPPSSPNDTMASSKTRLQTVLVTGANGYIGNAVARAFVRAGWLTYGLVRSESGSRALAAEEILPVVGSIDDVASHDEIRRQLPPAVDVIVSTTEDLLNYVGHYDNTIALLRTLALASKGAASKGIAPLVILTSGCKDYGSNPTQFAGHPDLAPFTEESPLAPPSRLAHRTEHSMRVFDHGDAFAATLVRPTNVHGRTSSYHGLFFEMAARAAAAGEPLVLPARAGGVLHCLHVDDCGDAYVALADAHVAAVAASSKSPVAGEVFNISAREYETIDGVGAALVAEYGIARGLELVEPEALAGRNPWPPLLVNFPQWTGSEKIRALTGWRDRRPLFTEALHLYRVAYEAAKGTGHEGVVKVNKLLSRIS